VATVFADEASLGSMVLDLPTDGRAITCTLPLGPAFPRERAVQVSVRFESVDGRGLIASYDGHALHLMDEDGHVASIAWVALEASAPG
jgi:hypothetical protein